MDTVADHLHIFKTNIGKLCPNCTVHKLLNNFPAIKQWSIDTDDADSVLRIVSSTLTPQAIISIINDLGHECAEL